MTQTTCPNCFQVEDMCDCPPAPGPHRYVPSGVSQHRTCAHPGCGRGANQQIHRV